MLGVTLISLVRGFSSGGGTDGGGQSCDAINICKPTYCPVGMTRVAPPERNETYSISASAREWVPEEAVTITVAVEKKRIQRRMNRGVYTCMCDPPYRHRLNNDCKPHVFRTGDPATNCTEPNMESATFLGLLLYAVDSGENKVGSWELPLTVPAAFHLPADTGCGGKAVMHADAQPKNYVSTFSFRAPSAGTGNLTFRALIKHGDTNGGSFYWPVAAAAGASKWDEPADGTPGGDLMLTEKTVGAPQAQQWYRANATGQSCDDVCAANGAGQVCDLAALQAAAATSPTELARTIAPHYTAMTPALSSCSASAPSLSDSAERLLFFHRTSASSNTCAANELTAPSCAAVPTEGAFSLRRLCPCKSSRRRLTFQPPRALPSKSTHGGAGALTPGPGCPKYTPLPTTDGSRAAGASGAATASSRDRRRLDAGAAHDAMPPHTNSAASLPASSATPLVSALALGTLAAALSGGFGFGGVHGAPYALALTPYVLLLAASQLPRATAHNWIYNPSSRASQASTARPCRAKRTATPDVHVNSGQVCFYLPLHFKRILLTILTCPPHVKSRCRSLKWSGQLDTALHHKTDRRTTTRWSRPLTSIGCSS